MLPDHCEALSLLNSHSCLSSCGKVHICARIDEIIYISLQFVVKQSPALLVKDNSFTHHVVSQNTPCVTVPHSNNFSCCVFISMFPRTSWATSYLECLLVLTGVAVNKSDKNVYLRSHAPSESTGVFP